MRTSGLGKYQAIVAAITMFVFFIVAVMALNFYISMQFESDAVGVNLASRQRMLSQRIMNVLLQTRTSIEARADIADEVDKLRNAYDLFDETHTAFFNGGNVTGPDGNHVSVRPVSTDVAQAILLDADKIWEPYKRNLERILSSKGPLHTDTGLSAGGERLLSQIQEAIDYANYYNVRLFDLMNDLTTHLGTEAVSQSMQMRRIQIGGIIASTLLFFVIVFYFVRNLARSDVELDHARRETHDILSTVKEGLFLIDSDLRIGSQYSRALERIFRRKKFAGLRFEDLLKQIVPEKTLNVAKDYVSLLFGDRVNENLIKTLNPLSEVEVHFEKGAGGFETYYLEFGFNRVKLDADMANVLVTVNDITQRILLSRELQESQEHSQAQLDLLLGILHIEPELLMSFLSDSEQSMNTVNAILKEPARGEEDFRMKLDSIFRQVHAVKGESSALGLKSTEQKAHAFEDMLGEMREKDNLSGNDFLPLAVRLDELFTHLASIRELVGRLADLRAAMIRDVEKPTGDTQMMPAIQAPEGTLDISARLKEKQSTTVAQLESLAAKVAVEQDKKVVLNAEGFEERLIPEKYRKAIKDISVQFVRNSVTHGIEMPEERLAENKPVAGTISLNFAKNDDGYELTFSDDGRGLQPEKIREVAIKRGIISERDGQKLDTKQVLSLIFKPGFSTSDEVTEDAGRGVGMDLVRTLVSELRGTIRMSTARGKHTSFRIVLPESEAQAA